MCKWPPNLPSVGVALQHYLAAGFDLSHSDNSFVKAAGGNGLPANAKVFLWSSLSKTPFHSIFRSCNLSALVNCNSQAFRCLYCSHRNTFFLAQTCRHFEAKQPTPQDVQSAMRKTSLLIVCTLIPPSLGNQEPRFSFWKPFMETGKITRWLEQLGLCSTQQRAQT